jgi:hypothetical protein
MNTPIEELMIKWTDSEDSEDFEFYFANNYTELQEKEKKIIIEAYNQCSESLISGDAEQYYNETFKK